MTNELPKGEFAAAVFYMEDGRVIMGTYHTEQCAMELIYGARIAAQMVSDSVQSFIDRRDQAKGPL